jgi:hypothetical protein
MVPLYWFAQIHNRELEGFGRIRECLSQLQPFQEGGPAFGWF